MIQCFRGNDADCEIVGGGVRDRRRVRGGEGGGWHAKRAEEYPVVFNI